MFPYYKQKQKGGRGVDFLFSFLLKKNKGIGRDAWSLAIHEPELQQ
jgi:hypothetical protein